MKIQKMLAAVLASASGLAVGQSVVFENLPDRTNGALADSTGVAPENRAADNFTLAADDAIGSIEFWGLWLNNNVGNESFTAVFYDDAGGAPGSVLATIPLINNTSTTTGADVFGFDEYLHTADLSVSFLATAGTTYYLSIFNDSGLGDDGTWAWGTSSAERIGWLSTDFGQTFDADGRIGGLAFRLVNVPSPAAASILGLSGLIGARRRR